MNLLISTILLFTLFLLLLLLTIYLKTKSQAKHLISRVNDIDNFKVSQFIMGQQSSFVFAADNDSQRFAYMQDSEDYIFPFDAVLSVEFFKNNAMISEHVSRRIEGNPELTHAYDQGKAKQFFAGDPSKKGQRPSKIFVRIILVGHHQPFIDINCFDAKTQLFAGSRTLDLTNHESQLYRKGVQIGNHLLMLLTKVIEQVDTTYIKDKIQQNPEVNSMEFMPQLIADELEKLSALRDKGVITTEEFESQKKKLMNP